MPTLDKTLEFKIQKMGMGEVIAIFWTVNDPPRLQGLRPNLCHLLSASTSSVPVMSDSNPTMTTLHVALSLVLPAMSCATTSTGLSLATVTSAISTFVNLAVVPASDVAVFYGNILLSKPVSIRPVLMLNLLPPPSCIIHECHMFALYHVTCLQLLHPSLHHKQVNLFRCGSQSFLG